jgi:hypothetical protein
VETDLAEGGSVIIVNQIHRAQANGTDLLLIWIIFLEIEREDNAPLNDRQWISHHFHILVLTYDECGNPPFPSPLPPGDEEESRSILPIPGILGFIFNEYCCQ